MPDKTPSLAVAELLRRLDAGEVSDVIAELQQLCHEDMLQITEILIERAQSLEARLRAGETP